MPSPTATTAINAINDLDSQLNSANSNLQDAAALHTQDQQQIAALQAKLNSNSGTSLIPPVFAGKLPNVLVGLERMPGWKDDTDHNTKVFPHNPPTRTLTADGWLELALKPAGVVGKWPSDNNYPHLDLPPQPNATMFAFMGDLMLPTQADFAACQGLEFQIEQCINGTTFDTCAWQFLLGGGKSPAKMVRWFDKVKKWQDSTIPLDLSLFAPGKVLSVIAESWVDHAAGVVHMTALTLNGQRNEFDIHAAPGVNQFPGDNHLQFSGFQQDAVQNQPYRLRVRNLVAMWL